jgi:hypothetical protein
MQYCILNKALLKHLKVVSVGKDVPGGLTPCETIRDRDELKKKSGVPEPTATHSRGPPKPQPKKKQKQEVAKPRPKPTQKPKPPKGKREPQAGTDPVTKSPVEFLTPPRTDQKPRPTTQTQMSHKTIQLPSPSKTQNAHLPTYTCKLPHRSDIFLKSMEGAFTF